MVVAEVVEQVGRYSALDPSGGTATGLTNGITGSTCDSWNSKEVEDLVLYGPNTRYCGTGQGIGDGSLKMETEQLIQGRWRWIEAGDNLRIDQSIE